MKKEKKKSLPLDFFRKQNNISNKHDLERFKTLLLEALKLSSIWYSENVDIKT